MTISTAVLRAWVNVCGPVVMDNLPLDTTLGLQEAIEAAGATVSYLPPHSADVNQIESRWSKVKQHLGSAAARMPGRLLKAVGGAMGLVTLYDCRGFFAGCRYTGTHEQAML